MDGKSRDVEAASEPARHPRGWRVRWPALLFGVLGLAGLSGYALSRAQAPVEQDLTHKADALLVRDGASWASARFEGRDGTLMGEALTEEARASARRGLEQAFGVRVVNDRTTLLPERHPFTFSAVKDAQAIALDGYVPSQEALDEIVSAATATGAKVTGAERLVRARGAPPGDFATLVAFGLKALNRIPSGRITLSDGALSIEGRAPDLATYEAMDKELHGPLPEGLTLARFAVRPPVASPFAWSATRDNGGVKLAGFLPSEGARTDMRAQVAVSLSELPITDETRLADGAPSLDLWLKAVRYAGAQLALLPKGTVSISDTAISIEGTAPSFAIYDRLSAARRAPPEGFQVTRFAVEAPRADPFAWKVERGANGVRVTGYAPSEEAKRALADAVRAAFPGVPVADEMQIASGGPSPEAWSGAASFAVAQLAKLRQGAASAVGARVDLSGEALDAAALTSMELAVKAPPGGVTVSMAGVKPPLISPYVFAARRDKDGLTISGFYPDKATHDAILAAIDADFLKEKVNDVSAIGGGAPPGFLEAVRTGLAQLSRLASGEFRLTDGKVHVAGETLQPEAAGEIGRELQQTLPQNYKPDASLTQAPPGPPAQADECQKLTSELLSKATILFNSASARIARGSYGLLDRLVHVTQRCSQAKVEVSGHTDDVGDDESNQRLSEARANAVVTYLVNAGVARDRLGAVGYGKARPVAPNDSDANRALNRRIEFVVK